MSNAAPLDAGQTSSKMEQLLTAQYQQGYKAAISDVRARMPKKPSKYVAYTRDSMEGWQEALATLSDILSNLEKK